MSEKKKLRRSRHGVRKDRLAWDTLDNTANLFPVIASEDMTNVYRISVSMTEEVERELLQRALDWLLPRFDTFRMRLKKGFFWYYFEENNRVAPLVLKENSYPGSYINKSKNNHYMFRVSYFEKRINLEVFHALSDGSGGIVFLTELIYQYLRLKHPELGEPEKISPGIFFDYEDSYLKNFRKKNVKAKGGYTKHKAFTVKGEKLGKGEFGVVHGYMPVDQLKKVSKEHGVTINQFLVGTYVYAIYKEYLYGDTSKVPISCCVPVNLRPYFDSHTLKNFFVMVAANFKPEKEEYSFEEILGFVADSLKEQITKENLEAILAYNVNNQRNIILRLVPLPIKNMVIKSVYGINAHATTTTMTNIGNITLKEPYGKYVEHFYAAISMSKGQNIKAGICSYNGTLVCSFTSNLLDLAVQKIFFQTIAKQGVEVAVETNDIYYED